MLKGVPKLIKNETKGHEGWFLSMLLASSDASLLGYLLSGKWILRAGCGNKKGKVIARDVYREQWDF